MGDPRVTERDNPLVRKLNAIQRINEESGSALGGGVGRGTGAPLGSVQGGSATVLPPPAVPLPDLEESLPQAESEELERLWAQDPSNPANKTDAAPENAAASERMTAREFISRPDRQTAREFMDYSRPIIDLKSGTFLTGGSLLMLLPSEVEAIRNIALVAATRALREETEKRITALSASWTPAKEPEVEKPTEAVSAVPSGEATSGVSNPAGEAGQPVQAVQSGRRARRNARAKRSAS